MSTLGVYAYKKTHAGCSSWDLLNVGYYKTVVGCSTGEVKTAVTIYTIYMKDMLYKNDKVYELNSFNWHNAPSICTS